MNSKLVRSVLVAAIGSATLCAQTALKGTEELSKVRGTVLSVPFVLEQNSGNRPMIQGLVNGKPLRLMIHANAGTYFQTDHAEAAALGITDLKPQGAYGITSTGKLSPLGRDQAHVHTLSVAGQSRSDLTVAIFEKPGPTDEGMLGLPWIHDVRLILDWTAKRAYLPANVEQGQAFDQALREAGYTAIPMTRNPETGRYFVQVGVAGSNCNAPFTVSSVSEVFMDEVFAHSCGVRSGKVVGNYGGPKGTSGAVHGSSVPVSFTLGSFATPPTIISVEDVYAYEAAARPAAGARGGELGADFMLQNHAIVNFGTQQLWLKR